MIEEQTFKLRPSLVPAPLWGRSVYNTLRNTGNRKAWEEIRRTRLEACSNCCHYCGEHYESRMVCHEVWEYDDRRALATLTALVMACQDCNTVLHFGKALLIGKKYGTEKQVQKQVLTHLRSVNKITKKKAEWLLEEVVMLFEIRSGRKWKIQIAEALISEHPALSGLEL